MSEEILNQILEKAAKDKKFCKLLFKKREAALAEFELNQAEKDMLMSATDAQLNQMINQKRSWLAKELVPSYGKTGCGAGTAAIGLVGFLLFSSTMTLGANSKIPDEARARHMLWDLAKAEAMYQTEFNCYADLETLCKTKYPYEIPDYFPYNIKITLKKDSYIITAIHKKRPNTRAQFEIGPDKQIKRIDPADAKK